MPKNSILKCILFEISITFASIKKKKKPMKNVYYLILLIAFGAIVSCSRSEENTPIIIINNLIVTSDSDDDVLTVNEVVNFIATGDDGDDYTDLATFYVNQVEIIGSSYEFEAEGIFSVNAIYENVNSNDLEFNVIDGTERVLIIDLHKALRNQIITFSLIDLDGSDITSTSTFYVNNEAIAGNTFNSSQIGEFEVYAEYELAGNTETTEAQFFEIYIPKRKVVIEDYTGTWCGFCPIVTAAIDATHALTDDIAIVTIHKTGSGDPDLLHFPQVDELKEALGVDNGYPKGRINRTTDWLSPYSPDEILSMAGTDTNLAIAINSTLSETNELVVKVDLVYEEGSMAGDKLVVYLLESGVIQDQVNYYNNDPTSPYYQMGNPIPNFEHNHGLRNSLTNLTGDSISGIPALEESTRTFSLTVPANYNNENLSIVVMVVSSDDTARNAQFADVGENKSYE